MKHFKQKLGLFIFVLLVGNSFAYAKMGEEEKQQKMMEKQKNKEEILKIHKNTGANHIYKVEQLQKFEDFVQNYPDDKDAAYAQRLIGLHYIEKTKFERARQDAEKLAKKYKGKPIGAGAQMTLGDYHKRKMNYQKAIEEYDKVIKQYPDYEIVSDAVLWQGACYFQLKNWDEAVKKFKDVMDKYPAGNNAILASQSIKDINTLKEIQVRQQKIGGK